MAAEQQAAAKAIADKVISDAAKSKKLTIKCVKGSTLKKVTAMKPKCPAGYKVKK